jgi:RND family efflux transporter MFP subunit
MFERLHSQFVLPLVILAIGAGGMFWLSAKDAPPDRVVTQPIAPLVETIELKPEVTDFQIHVNGNVVPRREVTLSAEVAGAVVLKEQSIESGRHVVKGTTLLQIDPARFKLQVDELASELKQVDADLRRLEIEEQGTNSLIRFAERGAEIATAALKRSQGLKSAVTDAQLESVERSELEARNALSLLLNQRDLIPIQRERLQAQRKLTELKQQQAQLNLDRTKITAPFTGVITAVKVEQGNYVQTGDVLFMLDDTSAVDVDCSLRLDDLYWLWNSREANPSLSSDQQLTLDQAGHAFEIPPADAVVTGEMAGRSFHWKGQLARFEGRGVDRKTRTVPCRVTVDQPVRTDNVDGPPTLMRGMFVRVSLNVAPQIDLWRIPTRAIQPDGQVWTVKDGVLRVHSVKPAKVLPDSVLVRADSNDLRSGDRLVVTQLVTPLDGIRVREREANRKVTGETQGKSDGPEQANSTSKAAATSARSRTP